MRNMYMDSMTPTAEDVIKAQREGRELEMDKCNDPILTKKAAAIIEQLDGLDYATACYLLKEIEARLQFTAIRADWIPV